VDVTLVLPTVNVVDIGGVAFDTVGFETLDFSSTFVGPSDTEGALHTYAVHELSGNARAVDF